MMKSRMMERLIFLMVGAIIAALAYAVGIADRNATAQLDTGIFETVICNELVIMDGLESKMVMSVKDGIPMFVIGSKPGEGGRIEIMAQGEGGMISITNTRDVDITKGVFLGISDSGSAALLIDGNRIR